MLLLHLALWLLTLHIYNKYMNSVIVIISYFVLTTEVLSFLLQKLPPSSRRNSVFLKI
jgi:hypothetical protein